MRVNFTAKYLESLPKPAENERLIVWDSEVVGLGARVLPSRITFFVQKKAAGRTQRVTYGEYSGKDSIAAARDWALSKISEIAKWKASEYSLPSPIRTTGTLTLASAVQSYIDGHLLAAMPPKERSARETKWMFKHYVGTTMQTRPLTEIFCEDIERLHKKVGNDSGHFAANRLLQMLRAAINYVIRKGRFNRGNVCEGVTRFPEPKRKRSLKAEELPKFFAVLANLFSSNPKGERQKRNRDFHDFVMLAPFVAARCGNVFAMKWSDLDLESKTPSWYIPQTKNGEPVRVELVPTCVRILKARRSLVGDSVYVFPGDGESRHVTNMYKSWNRFRKLAGVPDLRIHDLRHTAATFAKLSGLDDLTISRMLGHTNPQVTRSTYINLPDAEVRKGSLALEKKLLAAAKTKRTIELES